MWNDFDAFSINATEKPDLDFVFTTDEVIVTGTRNDPWVTSISWETASALFGDAQFLLPLDGYSDGGSGSNTGDSSDEDDEPNDECGTEVTAPDGSVYTLPPGYEAVAGGHGSNAGHHYMSAPDGTIVFTPYYAHQATQNYDAMMESNAEISAWITFGSVGAVGGSAAANNFAANSGAGANTLFGLFALIPDSVVALLGLTPPPPDSALGPETPCQGD